MTTPALIEKVKRMMSARGYAKVVSIVEGGATIIHGSEQQDKKHPRVEAQAIAAFYLGESYDAKPVNAIIRTLYEHARVSGVPPTSSIILIYSFAMKDTNLTKIEISYSAILQNSVGGTAFYFEKIPTSAFLVDWTVNRTTRKMRLRPIDRFVLMYTAAGKPLLIDKPPSILVSDVCTQYFGGRVGDCLAFEKLENQEIGPIWIASMRRVVAIDP